MFTFKEVSTLFANQLSRGSATKLCSVTVSPTAESLRMAQELMRCGEIALDRCWRRRLLYFHLTVLWAERWAGRVEPSALGMSRIAAGGTDAPDPTGVLPLAAGMAAGANGRLEPAMR